MCQDHLIRLLLCFVFYLFVSCGQFTEKCTWVTKLWTQDTKLRVLEVVRKHLWHQLDTKAVKTLPILIVCVIFSKSSHLWLLFAFPSTKLFVPQEQFFSFRQGRQKYFLLALLPFISFKILPVDIKTENHFFVFGHIYSSLKLSVYSLQFNS